MKNYHETMLKKDLMFIFVSSKKTIFQGKKFAWAKPLQYLNTFL